MEQCQKIFKSQSLNKQLFPAVAAKWTMGKFAYSSLKAFSSK